MASMAANFRTLALGVLLAHTAHGQFNPHRFRYPAEENLEFYKGQTLNVSYFSNYENPSLFLLCSVDGRTTSCTLANSPHLESKH